MRRIATIALFACAALALAQRATRPAQAEPPERRARAIALAEVPGDSALDRRIRMLQRRVAASDAPSALLERLCWAFVEKAREASDPGYYHVADQCGVALADLAGEGPPSWLLRGHALHGLHRFREAEQLARRAVETRGSASDHGLLGDALLDRGRLEEAASAYQAMMDLRPDSRALLRAARLRFLTGDPEGAVELMRAAARATSPRHAESFAWTWAQLARDQLALGQGVEAERSARTALAVAPESPDALDALGRVLLSEERAAEAADALGRAAAKRPLPEVQWWHAEALAAAGQRERAARVEDEIRRSAGRDDPRSAALFLASRGIDAALAVRLTEAELERRQDPLTLDAAAWALHAAGRIAPALDTARRALASGIRDARVLYHAGAIAQDAGLPSDARAWLAEARGARQQLLPSERLDLERRVRRLPADEPSENAS